MSLSADHSRRRFLHRAGLAATAAAALPLTGCGTDRAATGSARNVAATSDDGPDRLFRDGRFAEAERGYRRSLQVDPKDAHAAAQLGYIALLSNRFGAAERHLSDAVGLNPGDNESRRRLAECFVRQDRHARAIPILNEVGTPLAKGSATQYGHLDGTPYRISGPSGTRVPFTFIDPLPVVEASVNGSAPKRFLVDTYATFDLSPEAAKELGLTAVATVTGVASNTPVTIYLGVLNSLRIGGIEIRNLPVQWSDGAPRPTLPDGTRPAGAFGTTIMYHFLTTMDYARRALVLRRRGHANRSDGLPLWLAGDHYPCSVGSLRDYGPRMVTLDTGGIGHGLDTTVEIAERAGIAVDRDHPIPSPNGAKVYPCRPDRMSLGRAVGRNVLGYAVEKVFPGLPGPGLSSMVGFDLMANFSHEFFKPYAVTFDYASMRLRLARGR
ncbi:retropepsin-like aspartic protease [Actinomadura oligospora]|uniref:retropepsin-like aspartic protease n=1 Tax=Actinomadura oligospora TaxID=111804 RepID=UPI00047D37AD|nr:retropepsin-like aspartic protease [Actinomadura oligospora]